MRLLEYARNREFLRRGNGLSDFSTCGAKRMYLDCVRGLYLTDLTSPLLFPEDLVLKAGIAETFPPVLYGAWVNQLFNMAPDEVFGTEWEEIPRTEEEVAKLDALQAPFIDLRTFWLFVPAREGLKDLNDARTRQTRTSNSETT
jgi:hypothetical protein